MGGVLSIIEKETDGKSFKSHKYCNDDVETSSISYDDYKEVVWKNYGETEQLKRSINLEKLSRELNVNDSIFTYFLDGSRHTYKVDDISYNKDVYPILAGQVGVGCCKRVNREIKHERYARKFVIVLPDIAYRDGWGADNFFSDIKKKINEDSKLKSQFKIQFDDVLTYKRDKEDKPDKKGIAVIQDYMIELEKRTVHELVEQGKLNQSNYLIKDGSLEYRYVKESKLNLKNLKIANNYKYVIGVSKSFNPTKCLVKGGGTNSDIIAELKPFERTPVYMYQSNITGDVHFAIWYLRLRDSKYTNNIFDGIIKVEKLVIDAKEQENGIETEMINFISANLLNERNPVCYGSDERWANHIYPIYLTEKYIKSKYLSNSMFLQLF